MVALNANDLHFYEAGEYSNPDQPTLLLIHGAGGEHSVFAGQSRYLTSQGVNVLGLDLPGHGQSAPLTDNSPYSIEAFADQIAAACATLNRPQWIIVGHSMGALIALELAGRVKDTIGLCLMGAAAQMPVHPKLLELAENDDLNAAALIANWGMGRKGKIGGSAFVGVNLFPLAARLMGRQQRLLLKKDLEACAAYDHALETAKALPKTLSCHLIMGRQDKMTPPKAATPLIEALGATTTLVADSGHMMMLEQPITTAKALATWVRTII